ncbi:hypothetical protein AA14337_1474 [Acetobacter malorum DSM 14337]|uniref:Transposase n=1 Tax=Acetobacter malorum DSM 14337 TaxID=1307910 RepID=A0ABQ0PSF2_9PROT|nr:hypothetical protein AA14337_1474 [Acetobacter malorum DSM 14337]
MQAMIFFHKSLSNPLTIITWVTDGSLPAIGSACEQHIRAFEGTDRLAVTRGMQL